jgi:hypothetical protein
MKDTGKNRWLGNLPEHSPPLDVWDKIEAGLEKEPGGALLQEQLAGLPVHEPPISLWGRIEEQLARRKVMRIGYIASAIAATLFMAIIIRGLLIPEVKNNNISVASPIAKTENVIPNEKIAKQYHVKFSDVKKQSVKLQSGPVFPALPVDSFTTQTSVSDASMITSKFTHIPPLRIQSVSLETVLAKTGIQVVRPTTVTNYLTDNLEEPDTMTTWLLDRNTKKAPPPSLPKIVYQPIGFSLGFDYLPEPISNPDEGTSMYHSFGLMAQYHAPAIEFRSGIGISYYSIPADFSAQYISVNKTSADPTHNDTIINYGDTVVGLVEGIGGINIYGREQSRFLNYYLGAGKKIYDKNRFSATFELGAGFSLLLSKSNNLQGSTYEALRNDANNYFNNVESNVPDITRSRFNLLTGFDIQYRLLKKWSISLEPTLKYYFDPIYYGPNSKIFSIGLRTGILFKL